MTSQVTSNEGPLVVEEDGREDEDDLESWSQLAPRHRARLVALQVLYEVDLVEHPAEAALGWSIQGSPLPKAVAQFARELVSGVLQDREVLDERIHAHAPAWPVSQLSIVDRNILRLAIYELTISTQTPPRAAINEAVEAAKVLGSESSPRFINGVLGSIMETV